MYRTQQLMEDLVSNSFSGSDIIGISFNTTNQYLHIHLKRNDLESFLLEQPVRKNKSCTVKEFTSFAIHELIMTITC